MLLRAALVTLLLGSIGLAQGTLDVIPCATAPSGTPKSCSHVGTAITPREYYDLSIESVCVDQNDSWWHNKLISLEVDVTVGNNAPIKIPIYKDRIGNGCHVGANGFSLVNFIPNNGQGVTIQSSIYRSDANDGLKKILSLATTTASQPALTNYAAAAVPYVGMAVDFANQAYAAFGQPTTPWLNEAPSRLHPVGPNYDRFDLREGYLIQYSGNDNPGDGSLYVDSGEVRWVANDTPLRNGSSWILFKIRKIERRTDYTVTNWYRAWDNLLTDCYTSDIDANSFKNRYQQVITLLKADNDYTSGDRDQYVKDFTTVQNAIVTALGQNPVDRAAIRAAIDASRSPVQPANFVAKFGSPKDLPTISGAPTSFKFAIVPSQLANEVRNKFKR